MDKAIRTCNLIAVKTGKAKDKRGQPTESIDATTPKERESSIATFLSRTYPASLLTKTVRNLKKTFSWMSDQKSSRKKPQSHHLKITPSLSNQQTKPSNNWGLSFHLGRHISRHPLSHIKWCAYKQKGDPKSTNVLEFLKVHPQSLEQHQTVTSNAHVDGSRFIWVQSWDRTCGQHCAVPIGLPVLRYPRRLLQHR